MAIEKYGHLISSRVLWKVDTDEKVVALTFDDGPHSVYTPQLIDILDSLDVNATFFLVGRNLEKQPEIAKRLVAAGHEIGNHSYSHPALPFYRKKNIYSEIDSTTNLITQTLGVTPKLFRPPMGWFSPTILDMLDSLGYKAVIGDVYPRDPFMPGTDKIIDRVLKRTVPGSIIILHDSGNRGKIDRSQTIAAVPLIIKSLRERGYRFLTVTELMGYQKQPV